MDKRYQVFVSSTFKDLEVERQEVMHALLELDCIPSGMELFPAANQAQWELIQKVINDCDYYILIVGGRYGTISDSGLSYTEMEYRHAIEQGKPVIAFLHKNPKDLSFANSETSEEGRAKLDKFRSDVETRMCKYWSNATELGSVVSRSIVQLIKSTPAIGWVRGNEISSQKATSEILKLREQIDQLQSRLEKSRKSAPEEAKGLASGDEEFSFGFDFQVVSTNLLPSESWSWEWELSWNEAFGKIAPLLMGEANDIAIKSQLAEFCASRVDEIKQAAPELKNRILGRFAIHTDAYHTLMVQLRALGLIVRSEKTRSVKDKAIYWTLTPYGDEAMTRLRAIKSAHTQLLV